MGAAEVEAFLTSLAVDRDVAAATQNLALSAILFLYREVLEMPLPWLDGTGMRLMEGVRLRVKDVDFAARQITVRDGKGGKDRVTMLPDALARRDEPAGPVVKSMKILGAGGTALNEYSLVYLSSE
jgi:integrase